MEQFELHKGSYADNPYPFFSRLREEAPVFWHEGLNAYLVSRYEDCKWVDEDTETFLSTVDGKPKIPYVQQMDGPDHKRLRKHLTPAFSPRALAQTVAPLLPEIADELIDAFIGKGRVEIVSELADPMATKVISRLLNIPAEDEDWIVQTADDMLEAEANPTNKELQERYPEVCRKLFDYFRGQIERERKERSGSLISEMISIAEDDQERLTQDEVLANALGMVIAGVETTKRLITSAIFALIKRPEQLRLIKGDPELTKAAVEETLRYHSPNQPIMRFANKDVEIQGVRIAKGTRIYGLRSSANRDPRIWKKPDVFDLRRYVDSKLPPHMSFGWGPHLCLGAYLARQEVIAVLKAFFLRVENARFDPEREIRFRGFRNRGPQQLHVLFDPPGHSSAGKVPDENAEEIASEAAAEGTWTRVASTSDLKEGGVMAVKIGEQAIGLYNVDGEYYATDAVCTHEMAMLTEGYLEDEIIICPLHQGCFDVRTGKGLGDPIEEDLKTYPVRVVDDGIEILVS